MVQYSKMKKGTSSATPFLPILITHKLLPVSCTNSRQQTPEFEYAQIAYQAPIPATSYSDASEIRGNK